MAGALNDITIIGGIIVMFIALGVALPYIQRDFGTLETPNDAEALVSGASVEEIDSTVGAIDVLASVSSMFFWTFGALPIWLDAAIFIPLRLILILVIARNIWVGGGA